MWSSAGRDLRRPGLTREYPAAPGPGAVEYEINTALIEALNSVEKRASIETGQEVDRADINLRGGVAAQAEMLHKAFTLDELEAMDAKIEAARNGSTVVEVPAVVVPKVQVEPGCAAPPTVP